MSSLFLQIRSFSQAMMLLNQFPIQLLTQCLVYGKLNRGIKKDMQSNIYVTHFSFFFLQRTVSVEIHSPHLGSTQLGFIIWYHLQHSTTSMPRKRKGLRCDILDCLIKSSTCVYLCQSVKIWMTSWGWT